MPAMSAGLDIFKRYDAVVSLNVVNPQPWVKNAIKNIFELDDDVIYELWRFGFTYQTIGRCSIRVRESDRAILVVVVSEQCAKKVSQLFKGSKIAGQCTDLPRFSKSSKAGRPLATDVRYTPADNSAFSKYKKRAVANDEIPLEKGDWFEKIRKGNI